MWWWEAGIYFSNFYVSKRMTSRCHCSFELLHPTTSHLNHRLPYRDPSNSSLPNSYHTEGIICTMVSGPSDAKRLEEAKSVVKSDPSKAESIYKEILSSGPRSSDAALRDYETALMGLGELYRDTKWVACSIS